MTAAFVHAGGPVAGEPERLGHWVRALALVVVPVGPVAIALVRFVLPYRTVDEPAAMAVGVAANLGRQSLVLWLGLIAAMTIPPAVVWIGGLTYQGAPRLTVAALLLAVPGYLTLGLLLVPDVLMYAGLSHGLDPQTVARLVANSHPSVAIAEVGFVVGHVLGTVLLGLALWRSRAVPAWAAAMVTISQPVHVLAAVVLSSAPLDLAAWMMSAVGFAAAGAASLRRDPFRSAQERSPG